MCEPPAGRIRPHAVTGARLSKQTNRTRNTGKHPAVQMPTKGYDTHPLPVGEVRHSAGASNG